MRGPDRMCHTAQQPTTCTPFLKAVAPTLPGYHPSLGVCSKPSCTPLLPRGAVLCFDYRTIHRGAPPTPSHPHTLTSLHHPHTTCTPPAAATHTHPRCAVRDALCCAVMWQACPTPAGRDAPCSTWFTPSPGSSLTRPRAASQSIGRSSQGRPPRQQASAAPGLTKAAIFLCLMVITLSLNSNVLPLLLIPRVGREL